MGKASGVDDVYNMTDDQLATVKGLLEQLKPNVLKFAQQATDSVNSMTSGEAWLITGNLGNEDRVKDAGGPEIKGFIPKEGTVGWMDAEMIVKEGTNKALIFPFLEKAAAGREHRRELHHPRPPALQRGGLQGPRRPGPARTAPTGTCTTSRRTSLAKTTLKGPGTSTEKSIQLFNEVFGA